MSETMLNIDNFLIVNGGNHSLENQIFLCQTESTR